MYVLSMSKIKLHAKNWRNIKILIEVKMTNCMHVTCYVKIFVIQSFINQS